MQQAIASGTVINKRYQIQKKIPDTTSNRCYLAEDADQSNRLVVLSFPKMELQTLPGFSSAFEGVCQRLVKTRLNGLLKILGHGEYDSQPYAVLQYVTHETLENHLATQKRKESKVSVDDVLDWAIPLAVTLDELHQLDYVHSNVRPTTIFLGQNRQVLLGDFITEFTIQRLGAFKQVISSLDIADHLAPEYIKSNYNEGYDQYLLATIIYEALAGRSHFHNPGSSEAYRRQVATKFPEPLLTHRPELVGASRILSKALERNPVKRFDTCRELVDQLGSAQINPVFVNPNDKSVVVIKKVLDLDETGPSEPITTSIRSGRSTGRKKGLAWLGVLLLGLGAGVYAVHHFGGLDRLTTAWNDRSKESTSTPVIMPVDLASSVQSATELVTDKTASAANVVIATDSQSKPVEKVAQDNTAKVSDVIGVDGAVLDKVIGQTLTEGKVEFSHNNAEAASAKQIGMAVNQALQEAQREFMQKSNLVSEGAGISAIQEPNAAAIDDQAIDEQERKDSLSLAESNAQKLNEQILAANKLADERAAAAKLAADEKKRAHEEKLKKAEQESREAQATADTAKEKIANEVANPPMANDPFDEMQRERERLQAIKAEKIARISTITKDCVTGRKIHRQVAAGNLPYVKNCLSVGVDPNLLQSNRWSLLHLASLGGYLNLVKLLLAKGADVNARAVDGRTPLDMATERKQDRLATYLRSRGGVTSH